MRVPVKQGDGTYHVTVEHLTATLDTGFTAPASIDDGTQSSGTYTPSPNPGNYTTGGNWRKIINGGAFALAAPTDAGCFGLTIDITNNASAGAVTFSGFVAGFPKGDPLTTTDADVFKLHIDKSDAGVTGFIEALQ